jgi:hypothetical protein
MRPSIRRLALLAAVALGLACSSLQAAETLTAEAPPVGPFSRVEISGRAEIVLVQGDREAVVVEASSKGRSEIRVRSADGQLDIDVDTNRSWWSWLGDEGRLPTITVHFRTLEALTLSGAVKLRAASIDTPKLRIDASGATSMKVDALRTGTLRFFGSGAVKGELAGSASEQDVSISGAGDFHAPQLVSDVASVRVSGAGKVVVNVRKRLSANISGAGAIDYYGDPEVKQRISGAGKITRRGAEAAPVRLRAA